MLKKGTLPDVKHCRAFISQPINNLSKDEVLKKQKQLFEKNQE